MSSSVVSSREPLLAPQTGLHPISQMKTLWAGLPAPTLTVRGPGNLQELDINQLHQHTHTKHNSKKRKNAWARKYGFSIMTIPSIKKAEHRRLDAFEL